MVLPRTPRSSKSTRPCGAGEALRPNSPKADAPPLSRPSAVEPASHSHTCNAGSIAPSDRKFSGILPKPRTLLRSSRNPGGLGNLWTIRVFKALMGRAKCRNRTTKMPHSGGHAGIVAVHGGRGFAAPVEAMGGGRAA